MTGRRPNLRYIGTKRIEPTVAMSDDSSWPLRFASQVLPKPNARLGYDIRFDASVGVTLKSIANTPMYGEIPVRAAFPRNEYADRIIKIVFFL